MAKRTIVIISILGALLLIAGMGALSYYQFPGLIPGWGRVSQDPRGAFADPAKMPLEQKLAIGTLKLEGTNQAITAEEAKTLLPLWKAMKVLSTSSSASQDEINGLYSQIKEAMNPEQTQAIQKLTWTQRDLQALSEKYGVRFGGGNFPGANGTLQSPDQRATRIAQFRAQNGGQTGGNFSGGRGGFNGGGGFTGDGAGRFSSGQGGQTGQNGQTVQRTPVPGQNNARRSFGLNYIFIDPLIKLLEQRAGAAGS